MKKVDLVSARNRWFDLSSFVCAFVGCVQARLAHYRWTCALDFEIIDRRRVAELYVVVLLLDALAGQLVL